MILERVLNICKKRLLRPLRRVARDESVFFMTKGGAGNGQPNEWPEIRLLRKGQYSRTLTIVNQGPEPIEAARLPGAAAGYVLYRHDRGYVAVLSPFIITNGALQFSKDALSTQNRVNG